MTSKRIVFLGTPDFAAYQLTYLIKEGFNIVGVVTASDKKQGRGQQVKPSAVKQVALENQITVLQPTNLKNEAFQEELKALNADIQVVVAFRMLPEMVWNMPPLGTLNLHASYLPQYRGAAPINWAIINGEHKTGISTFLLKHEIDTGDILLQEEIEISENMSAGELHDKLMVNGAPLIAKSLNDIFTDSINPKAQDSILKKGEITHAPKIFKPDCKINWEKPAQHIHNLIRGLSPFPSAYSSLQKVDGSILDVKIYASVLTNEKAGEKGTIDSDNKTFLNVSCADYKISIKEVQLPGKKRLNIKNFLAGFDVSTLKKFI